MNHTIPNDDTCIVSTSSNGEFHQWASGTEQSCTFPGSGVTFTWNIPTSVGSLPAYSYVG